MAFGLIVLAVKGDWLYAGVVLAALVALALSVRAVRREEMTHESGPGIETGRESPSASPRSSTPAVAWAYMAIVWAGFAVIWLTATDRPVGRVLAGGCAAVALAFVAVAVKRWRGRRTPPSFMDMTKRD
jgi:hypothetical protein